MKNKIIKILNKPKIVISVTAFISLIVGILVYRTVGVVPNVQLDENVSDTSLSNYNDGQGIDLAFPKAGRVSQVLVKEGDIVHKGQILANLDYADAKGALMIAKANYEKVLNGATGADIDVARAAVETAQVALDQAKTQQEILVKNARKNLLNSGFILTSDDQLSSQTPPTISGTYLGDSEGQIIISEYNSSGGTSFKTSGLVDVSGMASSQIPQPIGNTGLYIKFPNNSIVNTKWILNIPNTASSAYTQNFNAYQSALATQNQVVANATAILNQAKSALLLKRSAARPEDVAAVSGALEVAQGIYDNNFIFAPTDGVVTAVNLEQGTTVSVNQKAISMIAKITK